MSEILSLVNTVSSTSIPVEIADAVNENTDSHVTVGGLMQDPNTNLDPDIESMNLPLVFFSGESNFDAQLYRRLHDHLRNNDYDVIHTHHNFTGSVSRILSSLCGLPVISTEHNDLRYFSVPQRVVNAATYSLADVHVYNSHNTKRSRGPIERQLSKHEEIIYNGVDLERIIESKDHELPIEIPEGTLITNVGVMTKQKNQRIILQAARILEQHNDIEEFHFVIAGSGPLEEELRKAADRLNLECVTFTGYLPKREQVYSLLHRSDIFLSPSIYEGFCVAAVEAMAAGLPVIVSDINVLHEVVGEPGVFSDPSDPASIAEAILDLIDRPEKRDKLGQKTKKRAQSKFSIEQTAYEYSTLYNEIAESSNGN